MTVGSAVLSAENISVRLGGRCILDRLSLKMCRGEVVGIQGENGSGKSTLIRVLSGDLMSSGTIRFFGKDISSLPQWKRVRLGIRTIEQQTQIVPSLQAAEFLTLAAWLLGDRAEVPAFDHMLAGSSTAGRPLVEFSAGQQRRVYLSALLKGKVHVLLLDEPTAGVAPSFIEHLGERITALAANGIAVCLIEHNIAQLDRCLSRVLRLQGGRLVS
jgi:ABC-type multidrug transport system ATPase subunit